MARRHAEEIASLAYGAFGKPVTASVVTGFEMALRGKPYKAAMRALERCMQHPGRRFAPEAPEILAEIRLEERDRAFSELPHDTVRKPGSIVWGNYRDGVPLTPEVFHRQVIEAKKRYPNLFDGSNGLDMTEMTRAINDMLLRQRPFEPTRGDDPWAHGRYQPGEDSETEFNF